ncbi:DUF6705 family protein [uncultured Chryseobacterium sp.]|uniref:DUF6705 family protein n=1 Tax=uncultured Chryseobacterium sp. TaxID=259322 RepID=UPI0025F8B989|nr:DUF6705 family protein [uncultured Chryseobacterium sp.]
MKIIFLLSIILLSFPCKGQQIYPLDTDFRTIPNNAYSKDINNELLPFIGTWKTIFNNKEIIIKVDKIDHHYIKIGTHMYYQDVLFIRYSIKNGQGTVIKNTMNLPIAQSGIESIGTFPNQNLVSFIYQGGDCQYGWGDVDLQLVDTTHIKWRYQPEGVILTNLNCPNGADTTIYLPETSNLIFTKQ